MYSVPNFEPVHFPMSGFNCCCFNCIQVSQETGKVVWYSYFLHNFPQFVVIHSVKGFSIVIEADVCVCIHTHTHTHTHTHIYRYSSCFFYDPVDVGSLISGFSAFSKSSLYVWKFSVHILLKTWLKDFEHYLVSMWNECGCAVVWTFFGIAFLWDWNDNWPFPVLLPLLSFPNFLAYWVQHFHSIIF